jgi:hypothetical protein
VKVLAAQLLPDRTAPEPSAVTCLPLFSCEIVCCSAVTKCQCGTLSGSALLAVTKCQCGTLSGSALLAALLVL